MLCGGVLDADVLSQVCVHMCWPVPGLELEQAPIRLEGDSWPCHSSCSLMDHICESEMQSGGIRD